MTVSTEVNQAAYTGNGVTTVFPYTFRILNASNLTVTEIDLLEVETVLVLGTDYSVTDAGSYNGGAVTLNKPLANGYSLVIERDLSIVQETDLRNQGTFFAEVHEDAFDYLTMIIQQVSSWIGLALRRPTIKSKFYDAKQYRISNLSDPISDQDAVNNRSMRSYVDKMIAGVIGGFGWFIQSGSGAIYRTFQDKMRDVTTPSDFDNLNNAISSAITRSTWLYNSANSFTLTVGNGGQFSNLSSAIDAACKLRPTWKSGNEFCEIKLKAGFVISEQIEIKGGADLSWIKITSEDTVVYSSTVAFTKAVTTYYSYKYLIYIHGDSKSPVFAIQIEEDRSNSDVCAFVVTEGAKLIFAPYSGARKFYVGVHATFAAEVVGLHNGGSPGSPDLLPPGYYLCDFSFSLKTALEAISHVRVHLPISKFEYNQDLTQYPAVFCIYGTEANFFGSSASHSNYTGWIVRDGCTVNLRYHKTIQCANIGLHCIHGAFVDARCDHTNETDATTSGKVLDPSAVLGFNGCYWGVRCESASNVEVAGTDFRNCDIGLQLATSANISGKACDFSGCDLVVQALSGVNVSIPRLYAEAVGKFCELQYGSTLTVWNLNISRNTTSSETRFIDARHNSVVSIYNCIKMDSSIGLVATDGSRLSISTGTIKVPAVRSFEGSQVSLSSVTFDVAYVTGAVKQMIISAGSTITAVTCTNSDSSALTLSTTKNSLSIAGTIFAS